MNAIKTLGVIALSSVMLLGACAGFAPSKSQQLHYNGAASDGFLSKLAHDLFSNPCAFGGVDRQADNHCLEASWDPEELLAIVNQSILDGLAEGEDCRVHTSRVLARLSDFKSYDAKPVYSCPHNAPNGVCHVSVLVTHVASNKRYVLDNGSVLSAVAHGGFGDYTTYVAALAGADHWTGDPNRNSFAFENR